MKTVDTDILSFQVLDSWNVKIDENYDNWTAGRGAGGGCPTPYIVIDTKPIPDIADCGDTPTRIEIFLNDKNAFTPDFLKRWSEFATSGYKYYKLNLVTDMGSNNYRYVEEWDVQYPDKPCDLNQGSCGQKSIYVVSPDKKIKNVTIIEYSTKDLVFDQEFMLMVTSLEFK